MRTPLLLLAPILTAFTGCSVKVDVADESTTTAEAPPSITTEKSRTAVEVGFLVDRESEPAHEPAPPPPTPDPPSRWVEDSKSSESDQKSVTVVENVINIQHLDIQRHHDTHYHFYEPRKSSGKAVKFRVEVVQKPERDERCERLMKEHLERVAGWGAMFRRDGR